MRCGLTIQKKLSAFLVTWHCCMMDIGGQLSQQVNPGDFDDSCISSLESYLADCTYIVTLKATFGRFSPGIDPCLDIFVSLDEDLGGYGSGFSELKHQLGVF